MHTQQKIAFGYDDMGNAPHLLAPMDADALERGDWQRAGQECICPTCDLPYRLHPHVQGCLWLHRICDGLLVKL